MDLIHVITRQEAIEDGTLIRFEDYLRDESVGRVLRVAFRQIWRCVRKFALGELIITPGAARTVQVVDILHCLLRHQLGDWGELEDPGTTQAGAWPIPRRRVSESRRASW